jgi:hypothetical protein
MGVWGDGGLGELVDKGLGGYFVLSPLSLEEKRAVYQGSYAMR